MAAAAAGAVWRTGALCELVSHRDPLSLDQRGQPSDGAVVRVEQQHRKGDELGGAVPAVGAVHQAGGLAVGETVILMTPPCLSLLKHLINVEGGAVE